MCTHIHTHTHITYTHTDHTHPFASSVLEMEENNLENVVPEAIFPCRSGWGSCYLH